MKANPGVCLLCGYSGNKAAMTKHLKTCSETHDAKKGKADSLFRIRVEDTEMNLYWLDVEIKGSAKLVELDQLLRRTWLECCGHLSSFTIDREHYLVPSPFDDEPFDGEDKSMDVHISKVLSVGTTFEHEYDFGSSTYLKLKVVAERSGTLNTPVRLLARNAPYVWQCGDCTETATWINTQEMYDSPRPFYCNRHKKASTEDDYLFLPVVNSPRMGICAYEGES